jgi:catechol 2,3-dioxygenase
VILRLAHVEVCAPDLDEARAFYVGLLGFVEHSVGGSAVYLRGAEEFDAWSLKISRGETGGLVHSGFRVSEPGDLDRIEAIHADRGVPVARVPAGTEPGQGDALRTLTPEGHRVEFFHDFDEVDLYPEGRLRMPMRDSHRLTGVPPGRIDPVSRRVPAMATALGYWSGDLGFSTAEIWLDDDGETPRVAWVRRTPRSHDVALGRNDVPAFHHFAYAVSDAAALLRAADLLGDARMQSRLEWGPSRHGATNAFAMYIRDPAGNRLELYTGDYVRDLDRPALLWRPHDYEQQGHSWWGNGPPATFGETQPLAGEWVA